ncbi:hypothetical protein VNO77_27059 [Canavalia gladiata]|uniref:Uncharacterized protein n=1 Tax=Canavalia gladiata TaxID=3824 RepID=A0AAN9Q653_CANGL
MKTDRPLFGGALACYVPYTMLLWAHRSNVLKTCHNHGDVIMYRDRTREAVGPHADVPCSRRRNGHNQPSCELALKSVLGELVWRDRGRPPALTFAIGTFASKISLPRMEDLHKMHHVSMHDHEFLLAALGIAMVLLHRSTHKLRIKSSAITDGCMARNPMIRHACPKSLRLFNRGPFSQVMFEAKTEHAEAEGWLSRVSSLFADMVQPVPSIVSKLCSYHTRIQAPHIREISIMADLLTPSGHCGC